MLSELEWAYRTNKSSVDRRVAKEIGAAVGVSKPLVDEGWVSETFQVGINGKKVAPDIYFAIGISGSLNHIIGMENPN